MLTQVNADGCGWKTSHGCARRARRIFGQYPRKGAIQVGSDGDLTIVDMDRRATLTAADMRSKTGFTSWEGVQVTAMPVYTVVRGRVVMDHGTLLAEPGFGRFTPGPGGERLTGTAYSPSRSMQLLRAIRAEAGAHGRVHDGRSTG